MRSLPRIVAGESSPAAALARRRHGLRLLTRPPRARRTARRRRRCCRRRRRGANLDVSNSSSSSSGARLRAAPLGDTPLDEAWQELGHDLELEGLAVVAAGVLPDRVDERVHVREALVLAAVGQ